MALELMGEYGFCVTLIWLVMSCQDGGASIFSI
jgi:hypothetical protein